MLGEASMSGVPPLGLPKIRSLVGGMVRPTFWASPEWSTRAKRITPLACKMLSSFSTVSSTECLLFLQTIPWFGFGAMNRPLFLCGGWNRGLRTGTCDSENDNYYKYGSADDEIAGRAAKVVGAD